METPLNKGLLKFYWEIVFRPYVKAVVAVIFLMLGGAFLETAMLGLGVPLLETATNVEQALKNDIVVWLGKSLQFAGWSVSDDHLLFALLVLVSVTVILRGGIALLQQYWTALVAKKLYGEVKGKLFEKTLQAQYRYLADKSRGTLLYNVNTPAIAVFQVISHLGKLVSSLLNVVCLVGLMLYLSWWATVTIGLVGIIWVQGWRRFIDKRAVTVGRRLYEIECQTSKTEVDALDGLKVVKSYALVSKMVETLGRLLRGQVPPHLKLTLLTQGITFINEVMASLIVLALGGVALVLQWGHMPFPKLVIFFVTLRRLSPLLAGINTAYALLNKEKKGIEIMAEILHTIPLEESGSQKVDAVGSIQLHDLHFHYPLKQEQPVLSGLNLVFRQGEITAVVGSTGAGKSTLASLVMGFYGPTHGRIAVNGIDLRELDLNAWRRRIGFVSQDIFLFNDTIRNNISLWEEGISVAEIENAARLAELHDHIMTLPQGYETVVGDRGLKLSGGQAQRVAIARAILRKPKVLIFDEATSALDNLTERAVYDAIQALRQEAVVLVIAHRLSTIRSADQICVLQNGKVVEQGTHEMLMRQGNFYSQLYCGAEGISTGGSDA